MYDELLPYYEKELSYLRRMGKEFARRYPKVARRLSIEGDSCEDPHVERLMEGFAFLTARIRRKLDDEFPEITEALLGVLYPHFLSPTPSMSIAQFEFDPKGCEVTTRYPIPRHSSLLTDTVDGMPCRFRTAYPVDLWPIRVADARFELLERSPFASRGASASAVIRLRLECISDPGFTELGIDQLRFYLNGDGPVTSTLYDLIFNYVSDVKLVVPGQDSGTTLPIDALRPVGFEKDEGLLDYDARSFLGYRLIHEYFAFPEKFLFFDLRQFVVPRGADRQIEIVLFLSDYPQEDRFPFLVNNVTADTFALGCTPVVNLFKRQAEPIRISSTRDSYQVIPDIRRVAGHEVYSVDSVREFKQSQESEETVEFAPIYSYRHGLEAAPAETFWVVSRRASVRRNDAGTDVFLSLVDPQFDPSEPAARTLSVAITCTNRDLPGRLKFGGANTYFEREGGGAEKRIRCLRKPTPTLRAPLRRGTQWRLISHLSLNHLSIVDGGREALMEILSLYNPTDDAAIKKQIAGIMRVSSQPDIARVGVPPRVAFCRGTLIELELDEEYFVGTSVILFSAVLERFFGLYSAVNSYSRLSLQTRQTQGVVKTWPPRAGDAILL